MGKLDCFGVPLQYVIVEWLDAWKSATDDAGLQEAAAGHKPTRCFTGGWLLIDDTEGIQLSAESSPAENLPYRQRAFIPRAMVVDVYPQKLSKPRKSKLPPPNPHVMGDTQ